MSAIKKDTNPKDSVGVKKVPMHCVSGRVLLEMGLGMLDGGRKYGTHNYRSMGVRASVYFDAVMRHLLAFWEGEDTDPESGLPHIIKAITSLTVLRDSQVMGNWKDDRPVYLPGGAGVAELNKLAAKIIKRCPKAKKPFTELGKLQQISSRRCR